MDDMELYRRLAALERRVTKLEVGMAEIDQVVDPQGWIGEAFHVLEEHVDNKFREIDAKLDTVLRHLTGLDQPESGSD